MDRAKSAVWDSRRKLALAAASADLNGRHLVPEDVVHGLCQHHQSKAYPLTQQVIGDTPEHSTTAHCMRTRNCGQMSRINLSLAMTTTKRRSTLRA